MAEQQRVAQYVSECVAKAVNVVLSARAATGSGSLVREGRRSWFNLEVPELLEAQQSLDSLKKDLSKPVVLEIYIQPRALHGAANLSSAGKPPDAKMLERWTFEYAQPEPGRQLSRAQLSRLDASAIYKRMAVLLRTLYSYVRILPAFRVSKRSRAAFSTGFTLGSAPSAANPHSSRLERFAFAPIETPFGFFRAGVDFQPAAAVQVLEQIHTSVAAPQIIHDYLGSSQVAASPGAIKSSLSYSLKSAAAPGQQEASPVGSLQPGTPSNLQRAISQPPLLRRQSWSLRQHSSPAGAVPSPQEVADSHESTLQPLGDPLTAPLPPAQPPASPAGGDEPWTRQHSAHGCGHAGVLQQARAAEDVQPASRAASPSQSNGRKASAPVCIPAAGVSRTHASTTDLMGMQGSRWHPSGRARDIAGSPQARPGPSSAPAPSHVASLRREGPPRDPRQGPALPVPAPKPDPSTSGQAGSQGVAPHTPPVLPQMPSLGSDSEGSFYGSFPVSCSPMLPFACTPSAHSLASLHDPQAAMAGAPAAASPPLSGHNGAGALTVTRRLPSWSLQSSGAELGPRTMVGYSVSPMMGSMESSLLSGSTPRYSLGGRGIPHLPHPILPHPGSQPLHSRSSEGSRGPPRITYPQAPAPPAVIGFPAASEDAGAESDVLPFVLESEPAPDSHRQSSGLSPPGKAEAVSTAGSSNDAEVGAFVRLMKDAPPLRGAGQRSGMLSSPTVMSPRAGPVSTSEAASPRAARPPSGLMTPLPAARPASAAAAGSPAGQAGPHQLPDASQTQPFGGQSQWGTRSVQARLEQLKAIQASLQLPQ